MSRITKSLAAQAAEQMVKKTVEVKLSSKQKELKSFGDSLIQSKLDKGIREAFLHAPSYFNSNSRAVFVYNGLEHCQVDVSTFPSDYSYDKRFEVSLSEYKHLVKLKSEVNQLKNSRDVLRSRIESTLLSLVTYKKILEAFPEAAEYLPSEECTALCYPIEEIRTLLTSYK